MCCVFYFEYIIKYANLPKFMVTVLDLKPSIDLRMGYTWADGCKVRDPNYIQFRHGFSFYSAKNANCCVTLFSLGHWPTFVGGVSYLHWLEQPL